MKKYPSPLAPHLQIYKWQISSLLSITHRIVGVINIVAITIICFWAIFLSLSEVNYENVKVFLDSFLGKFLIIRFKTLSLFDRKDFPLFQYLGFIL